MMSHGSDKLSTHLLYSQSRPSHSLVVDQIWTTLHVDRQMQQWRQLLLDERLYEMWIQIKPQRELQEVRSERPYMFANENRCSDWMETYIRECGFLRLCFQLNIDCKQESRHTLLTIRMGNSYHFGLMPFMRYNWSAHGRKHEVVVEDKLFLHG